MPCVVCWQRGRCWQPRLGLRFSRIVILRATVLISMTDLIAYLMPLRTRVRRWRSKIATRATCACPPRTFTSTGVACCLEPSSTYRRQVHRTFPMGRHHTVGKRSLLSRLPKAHAPARMVLLPWAIGNWALQSIFAWVAFARRGSMRLLSLALRRLRLCVTVRAMSAQAFC